MLVSRAYSVEPCLDEWRRDRKRKQGGRAPFFSRSFSFRFKNQTKKRPPTKFQSFIGALPYETRLIGRTWHLRPMAAKPPLEPNHAWLPLEARGWLRLWLGGGSSVSPGIFYSSASRAPRLTPRALPHARDALEEATLVQRGYRRRRPGTGLGRASLRRARRDADPVEARAGAKTRGAACALRSRFFFFSFGARTGDESRTR